MTSPSRALTCASGLAPTATWPGVTIANVQYAPRSYSRSARNQVSAAVVGIGVDARREVAADDEVRALAAADLVGDDPPDDVGVLGVGDVEAGVRERDRRARQLLEQILARDARAPAHDEAAQRRAVVVALEAALAHLAERDQREHLAGRARGIRQRDVGEQVDVDDLAGEQLDGRVVAGDQGERDAAAQRERRAVEGGGARCHRRPFIGSGGRSNEKDRPRAVCGLGTRTHRRQRAGHHVVRFADMRSR